LRGTWHDTTRKIKTIELLKHIEPLTRSTDACINFAVANSSLALGPDTRTTAIYELVDSPLPSNLLKKVLIKY
ncbi:MAG: hypothetical protein RLZZ143_1803, partial [Cyanobacteriota bacterium]